MQSIFNAPMVSVQPQEPLGRDPLHRKATDPIDHFMADISRFEDLHRALDPKDLLDPFPLFAKPVIEIRATGDVAMFDTSMCLVPGFGLLPSLPIGSRIFKQIGDIFPQCGLVVFGNQQIVSKKPMDLRTQFPLGMHGVQRENAPFDHLGGQEGLERTDLILFFPDIAVPQDDPSADLVTTQLMNRLRL